MTAPAAAASRSSRRSQGRSPAAVRYTTAGLGIALVAALFGGATFIYEAFTGTFSDKVTVQAILPPGQPVDQGNDVEYLGAPVGTVADKGRSLGGGEVEVHLKLDPATIAELPANVTATVAPTSLFGKENVILQAPDPAAAPLRGGQVIPASVQTPQSLQGTLSSLNRLLTGLHPAEIDTTLNALSTALDGQAPSVTAAVSQLGSFLDDLNPQLPTLEHDVYLMSPLLNGLAQAIPSFLDFAGNASTTAATITQDEALIARVLAGTTDLAGTGQTLLQQISASLHTTLVDLLPFLSDVATVDPKEIPDLLTGIDQLARTWAPSFGPGPALTVTGKLYVENPTALIFAGTGILNFTGSTYQITKQGFGHLDPPTYTAADCPRYGWALGPNCPGASASGAPRAPSANGGGQSAGTNAPVAAAPSVPSSPAGLLGPLSGAVVPSLSGLASDLGGSRSAGGYGSVPALQTLMLAPVVAGAIS